MERSDAEGLQNLFRVLNASLFSTLGKTVVANPLHTNSNIVGGLELGFKTFSEEMLRDLNILYCISLENKDLLRKIEKKVSLPILIFQDSHGSTTTNSADFVLPSTTFVEKNSVYYNMEGRPQKTQRALVGPNLARDDWRILRVLFSYMKKTTLYGTQAQLITEASKILPSFYFANSWFSKRNNSVASCLPTNLVRKEKIYVSYFKLPIEDFYMTNRICQSSRIMAKASQYLRSYFHNYKFLTYVS
jgi:NADH dehydrogenase/NADH:ubiquinone oxidoreductase subunit G